MMIVSKPCSIIASSCAVLQNVSDSLSFLFSNICVEEKYNCIGIHIVASNGSNVQMVGMIFSKDCSENKNNGLFGHNSTMISHNVNNVTTTKGFAEISVKHLNNLTAAETKDSQFMSELVDDQTVNCSLQCGINISIPVKDDTNNMGMEHTCAFSSNLEITKYTLGYNGDSFIEADLTMAKRKCSYNIAEHFEEIKPSLQWNDSIGLSSTSESEGTNETTSTSTENKSLGINQAESYIGNFLPTVELCKGYTNYSNFPRFVENRQLQYEALLSKSMQTEKEFGPDLETQYLTCKHDKMLNVCRDCYLETHLVDPLSCTEGNYCYEDYFAQYFEDREQFNSDQGLLPLCSPASCLHSSNKTKHGAESSQQDLCSKESVVATVLDSNPPLEEIISQDNEMNKLCDYSTLHDLTVKRDHKHFISQQNFCAFYSSKIDPPPIPVPYPLQFCHLSSRPLARCPCDKCFSNHLTLLANFKSLNEYRTARLKSDNERRKLQNEELLRKIEASLEEGVKEELNQIPKLCSKQDANLPLKKRKKQLAFTEDVLKLDANLPSYPCTRMISIADLENKTEDDEEKMNFSLYSEPTISNNFTYLNKNKLTTKADTLDTALISNIDSALSSNLCAASGDDYTFYDNEVSGQDSALSSNLCGASRDDHKVYDNEVSGQDIRLSESTYNSNNYLRLNHTSQVKENNILFKTMPEDTRLAAQNLILFSNSSLEDPATTGIHCITDISSKQLKTVQKNKVQKTSLPRRCKKTQRNIGGKVKPLNIKPAKNNQ